jgi:hypothetical protein
MEKVWGIKNKGRYLLVICRRALCYCWGVLRGMHEVIGKCVCVSIGLESNKVVMMTVHDHIEGSFEVGPIRSVGRAPRWGNRRVGERGAG